MVWPSLFGAGSWALLAAASMTYAVCEEIARYLSFRAGRSMRENRTADGALAAGVGHGGAESVLFGLQYAWGMAVVWLLPQALPPGAVERLAGSPWWTFLLTGVERPIAIACHVGFATLIVLAYRRSALFLPVAIAAHFVVDFATFGLQNVVGGFWHDLLFLAFAITAVLVFRQVRRSCPRVEAPEVPQPAR
ncbi:YhfC family glutamic-type intramembrane protease [Saccharopolyspora shandongensis]|uniref:YhfC family glutamic-type intramembrane protease n=1 Tax=Saccharopolyspora shandongensis TaxID=418495 RepID=UPI003F4CB883